jgi:hypothetical protein
MPEPPNPPRQAMRPSKASRQIRAARTQHGHEHTTTAKHVLAGKPKIDAEKDKK